MNFAGHAVQDAGLVPARRDRLQKLDLLLSIVGVWGIGDHLQLAFEVGRDSKFSRRTLLNPPGVASIGPASMRTNASATLCRGGSRALHRLYWQYAAPAGCAIQGLDRRRLPMS